MAIQIQPSVTQPAQEAGRHTRRALLAAALGGVAASVAAALGRPSEAQAAAGDPLILGSATNNAGSSNTKLTTNSTGSAMEVVQLGSGTAVRSSANNGIAGYFGSANGTGVSGVVANGTKYGVYGANNAASYAGGAAIRADGKKNHGVIATSSDPAGVPLRGLHQNTSGLGVAVKGESNAESGIGVHGVATSAGAIFTAETAGVLAEGRSAFGHALRAVMVLPGGDLGGTAVHASAPVGVGGDFTGGQLGLRTFSPGIGIYAQGTSYAGYFQGATHVNGALSKSSGTFKIDHPLDPANKFLSHSFVESPDMKNFYDGVVDLDADGLAVVDLPDWFHALNRDFRYQLTSIGGRAQAWIVKEIDDGRFTIGSDTPNARISWQITGSRQDAWAKAHPVIVEEDKLGPERGRYLHPREHGRQDEDGMMALFKPKTNRE